MSHDLKEGTNLSVIFWPEGGELTVTDEQRAKGAYLKVIHIAGQAAWVPWVKHRGVDGTVTLYNCALMEGVKVAPGEGK